MKRFAKEMNIFGGNAIKSAKISVLGVLVLLLLSLVAGSFGQSGGAASRQGRDSDNKADQNLRSVAKVNPSTLAMEMSIPFVSYPGRNGNSLPIAMSYSSKLWRMDDFATYFYTTPYGGYRQYVTQLKPVFAERSAAGWTSSLAVPIIEEKLDIYNEQGSSFAFDFPMVDFNETFESMSAGGSVNRLNQAISVCRSCLSWYYDEATDSCKVGWNYFFSLNGCGGDDNDGGGGPGGSGSGDGGILTGGGIGGWGDGGSYMNGPPPPPKMRYVKRMRVRMASGTTHEFRKSDSIFGYCNGSNNDSSDCEPTTPDRYGMFLAVDGSGMKLERTAAGSTLYLPDGSRYLFPSSWTRGYDEMLLFEATGYVDSNGNKSTFSETTVNNKPVRTVTDTLGRTVTDFLPGNLLEQEQEEGTQQIVLQAMPGQTLTYEAKWLHLKPVPCEGNTTANCGDPEGALENQSQNLYYYTSTTCFGSAENPIDPNNQYPNEKLFPLNDNGLRSCNPFDGNTPSSVVGKRFNPVVLAELKMPNGKKYEFKYNQYGEITKIIYPTGSYETFAYAKITPMNGFNSAAHDQTNRGVVQRDVYLKKENGEFVLEQRWKYSAQFDYNSYANASYRITTTAPKPNDSTANGAKTERYLHVDTRNQHNFGFSDPRAGMTKEEKNYDQSGNLRARTLTELVVASPRAGGHPLAIRDPRVSRTVSVIIEGDKALATLSKTEYDEPSTLGNNAQSDPEYFSHLNAKRKKSYHFKVIQNLEDAKYASLQAIAAMFNDATDLATVSETDYLYEQDYLSSGITSLPKETKTLNPANINEVLAKSQVVYDNAAPAADADYPYSSPENYGITGGSLDCSANPSEQKICWQSAGSGSYRGRATTSRIWNKDNNSWIETHTKYDIFGNAVKVKDPAGNEAATEFGAENKYAYPTKTITSAPDPTGIHGTNLTSQATTTYNFMTGLALTVTDDFGQTTKTEYEDALLRPTKIYGVNYTAPITETIYDDTNLTVKVRKQIDENNWDETMTYSDSLGRAVKTQTKDSQGNVFVETKYDFLGRVQMMTNPYRLSDTQKYWNLTEYDELGRGKQAREPVVNQDPNQPTGNILSVTEYDLATAGDSIGTVAISTDAAGRKSRSITNALGQLIRMDEPSSTNTVEPLPLPIATPSPTPTPRDNDCYELRDSDPDCLLNRSNSLTNEFPSVSTYYKYDVLGNMTVVTQGAQKRYFKYDSLGRLIRVRQPEQEFNDSLDLADTDNTAGKWTAGFAYDIFGNVKRVTDANGVNIVSEYDKANRIVKRCYTKPNITTPATECSQISGSSIASADTPLVEYFYDGKGLDQPQSPNYARGKLTKVTSAISETRYKLFNNLGRLLESEQRTPAGIETLANAVPRVSKYEYNLSGALVQQTYPSGRTVRNSFEADGDLSQVQSRVASTVPFKPYVSDFSYTAAGAISQLKLGNGRWETVKLNSFQQITELALGTSSTDASLWKLNYDYGELQSNGVDVDTAKNTGNIAKQTISFSGLSTPLVQTYKYDSLERLTEARETSGAAQTWKQQFGYDRFGNRAGFAQIIGQTQLQINNETFPEIDPLTNRFKSDQNYTYDKNGNLTINAQNRQFYFNGDNKQAEVRDTNGNKVGEYFFDGEGRRVKKRAYVAGEITEETIFVYDGAGKLVAEYSTAPPVTRTTNYTTSDHLGSPRVITDANGTPISRRDFMPFGEELNPDASYRTSNLKYGQSDSVRQRFTGYQKDTETGLDFAAARMYENRHGRFTAVDPLTASGKSANPQTFNRYVYVGNNPIYRTDPSGLDWYFKDRKYRWSDDNKVFTATDTEDAMDIDDTWTKVTMDENGEHKYFTPNRAMPGTATEVVLRMHRGFFGIGNHWYYSGAIEIIDQKAYDEYREQRNNDKMIADMFQAVIEGREMDNALRPLTDVRTGTLNQSPGRLGFVFDRMIVDQDGLPKVGDTGRYLRARQSDFSGKTGMSVSPMPGAIPPHKKDQLFCLACSDVEPNLTIGMDPDNSNHLYLRPSRPFNTVTYDDYNNSILNTRPFWRSIDEDQ